MNIVWNASKTAEAIERRQRGETLKQIAAALGTSITTVFQALRKAGIPALPRNYVRWSLDMDEKLMMMLEQGHPQRIIADVVGVEKKTLVRRCKILGIEAPIKEKKKKEAVEIKKKRVRWTEEMICTLRQMRSEGRSSSAIAFVLGIEVSAVYSRCSVLGI
jgi:hypothetical protein